MAELFRGPRMPVLPLLHFVVDPLEMVRQCAERYGDPFIATLPLGRLVVMGTSEAIKEFFTADGSLFEPNAHTPLEPVVGSNSLLLVAGARHQRERKLLMPPFHGERMRAYGRLMQRIAVEAMERMRPGEDFKALHLAQETALEVIIRAVFGVEEPERVRHFARVTVDFVNAYGPIIAMLKVSRQPWFKPWTQYKQKYAAFEQLLLEQVERRRASNTGGEDILSLLLAVRDEEGHPMSDEELRDELRTMLVAGHETSAISMAWAMYWIHRQPEVKQRLEQELATLGPSPEPDALVKLPYLSAVIDETLRICPVFAMTSRRTVAPFKLLGHELPIGTRLAASITLAHYNPKVFPEPERFRPERFLEHKFSPYEYLPFGGGYRRCIGMAFALYEIKVLVGTLLANYRFTLTHTGPVKMARRNLSLGPSVPIPMRYEGKAPAVTSAAA
ncbi:cytochrome P450 [Hyalangium versicolor]|uniref:cytochrome P450 n=1 Tax=Hyalangium versicolor TaxID=2861190 RepID=UPI001CC9C3C6|nr:cytochrome P450 [Hyalangium versicolor]